MDSPKFCCSLLFACYQAGHDFSLSYAWCCEFCLIGELSTGFLKQLSPLVINKHFVGRNLETMCLAHSSSNVQFIHSPICITLPSRISSSFTRLSSICVITYCHVEVVPAFIRGNPLKLAWYFIDHPSITSLFSRITRCSGSAFDFSAPNPGIISLSKDFWISFIQKGIYKQKSRYQIHSSLQRGFSSQALSADTMRESLCTHIHILTCTHTYMVTSHFFSITTSIY